MSEVCWTLYVEEGQGLRLILNYLVIQVLLTGGEGIGGFEEQKEWSSVKADLIITSISMELEAIHMDVFKGYVKI